MRNLIRALRGKPVDLSPKQQEKLAKAQAKADAIIAEREAAGRKAMEDSRPVREIDSSRRSTVPRTRSARCSTTAATSSTPARART